MLRSGDIIKIDNIQIEILYPDGEEIVENSKNNNAIVCKLIWNNFSVLFTGDIEEKAERKILNMYEECPEKLKSDILKVAHHGSKTSSMNEFIKMVNPEIALIGVGKNNKFGHPNTNVLERLQLNGTRIYRTDQCGEISIKVNKEKYIVKKQIK